MNILMRIKNSHEFFKLKHETLKKCTAWGRLLWPCPRSQGREPLEKLQCKYMSVLKHLVETVSGASWNPLLLLPNWVTEQVTPLLWASDYVMGEQLVLGKLVTIRASWPRRTTEILKEKQRPLFSETSERVYKRWAYLDTINIIEKLKFFKEEVKLWLMTGILGWPVTSWERFLKNEWTKRAEEGDMATC